MSRAASSRSASSMSLQESLASVYGPTLLILLGILSFATLLRTQHLETISFWFDEACSWRISQFEYPEMMDAITRDAHPPLYYLMLRSWMSLFGSDALSARVLSVCCGVLTVLTGWAYATAAVATADSQTARAKADPMWVQLIPLLAALLLTLSPLLIELSHEARPYALAAALALSAGTCLLWGAKQPKRWYLWLGFAVTAAALTMTHYYGLFTVAAMLLWGLGELMLRWRQTGWSKDVRRFLNGWLLGAIGITLVWLPWVPTFLFQRERAHAQLWIPPFQWDSFAAVCWQALAGGKNSMIPDLFVWGAPLAWGTISILVFARCGPAGRLTALCAMVPLLASIVYGLAIRNILEVRYLSLAVAFLLVGCAQLLGRERFPAIRTLGIVTILCWLGFWTWNLSVQRGQMAEFPGTHGAVSYLNANRDPGSPVVVNSPFVYPIVLQYAKRSEEIWTLYDGDHRARLLGGSALRHEDYTGIPALLESRREPLWILDVEGRPPVRVPDVYKPVSEEAFTERFGGTMTLHVRRYELKRGLELSSPTSDQLH